MPSTAQRIQPSGLQIFRAGNQRWYPEGSSAGFKEGDIVKLSSGKVVIAVAAGSTLAASAVLGMALADASGTSTGTPTVPVYVFDDQTIWRTFVVSGSSSASTALTDVGLAYGIRHTATTDLCGCDAWAVDKNETSAVYGQVEDIPTGTGIGNAYPITEAFGTVDFRFNSAKLQGAGTTP